MRTKLACLCALALALPVASGCKRLASFGRPQPIVDRDYQFRLESPGRKWKLLGEAEARRLVPDAVAGAMQTGLGTKDQYCAIIVERYSGDLDAYVKLLVDTSALEDKKLEAREALEFQKRPAIRTTMRGSYGGLKVVFQHLIFLNRGYGYQIVSWGLDGQVDVKALGAAASSFTLLDGAVHERVRVKPVPDAHGPGWQVKDGVFRSAAWGIEVVAPASARVVVGAELSAINAGAEVGLVTSQPEAYLLVLPEYVAGYDPRAMAEVRMAENVARMGLEPDEGGFAATVLGQAVAMHRYHSKTQPFVYVQGAAVVEDTVFVLLGWHLKANRDDPAHHPLAAALEAIKPLGRESRHVLAADLAALPDPQSSVGPDHVLRHLVYRNFTHAITWAIPQGACRITVGSAARATQPNALVTIEEQGTGVAALLMTQAAEGFDGASYHAAATAKRYETKHGRLAETATLPLAGGVLARATTGDRTIARLPMVEEVVTWVNNHQAYKLLLWGPRPAAAKVRARFGDILHGLAVGPVAQSKDDGSSYVDQRMGFSFAPPALGGAWSRQDATPKEMAPIGAAMVWKNSRYSVTVLALYAMDSHLDEEAFVARFARTGVLGVLSSPHITVDKLAGVEGKRLRSGTLTRTTDDVIAIRRDRTFYAFSAHASSGSLADADLAALRSGFELIE